MLLISPTPAVLLAALLPATVGASVAVCLLVVMLVSFVTVVGHETIGHRSQQRMLESISTQ